MLVLLCCLYKTISPNRGNPRKGTETRDAPMKKLFAGGPNRGNPRKGTETGLVAVFGVVVECPNRGNPRKGTETPRLVSSPFKDFRVRIGVIPARGLKHDWIRGQADLLGASE